MNKALYHAFCLTVLHVTFCYAQDQQAETKKEDTSKPLISVSKETTRIVEPLTADGRVDYFLAFDQYVRRDVTPENNAGVLVVQALGPSLLEYSDSAIEEKLRADFYQRLQIPALSADDDYFVRFREFVRQRDTNANVDEREERRLELENKPWKRTDDPTVFQWLQQNEDVLQLLTEASNRPRFYIPTVLGDLDEDQASPPFMSMLLIGIAEMRHLSQALLTRAMLRLGEGDVQAAREDLMTIHRLARLISQTPLLINRLVAYSHESMACRGDFQVAYHGQLTATTALKARQQLEQLPPLPNMVEAMDVGERYSLLDATQTIAYSGTDSLSGRASHALFSQLPTSAAINYDVPMRMANDFFDRIVAAMQEADPQKRSMMFAEIENELQQLEENAPDAKSIALSLFRGNLRDTLGKRTGAILLGLLLPATFSADQAKVRTDLVIDLARIAYALAAYHADHGHYPQTLDLLAPKYIAAVPGDAFSNGELQYVPKGETYSLYSVGMNGIDENGRDNHSNPEGDDIAVRLAKE